MSLFYKLLLIFTPMGYISFYIRQSSLPHRLWLTECFARCARLSKQSDCLGKKEKSSKPACLLDFLAESQGFEPWVRLRTQHFECCTIDHSDNSPKQLIYSTTNSKEFQLDSVMQRHHIKIYAKLSSHHCRSSVH